MRREKAGANEAAQAHDENENEADIAARDDEMMMGREQAPEAYHPPMVADAGNARDATPRNDMSTSKQEETQFTTPGQMRPARPGMTTHEARGNDRRLTSSGDDEAPQANRTVPPSKR